MGAAAKASARKAAKDARDKKWEEGGVLAKASVLVSSGLEFAGDNLIATVVTLFLIFGSLMYYMCCGTDEEYDGEEYANMGEEDINDDGTPEEQEAEMEALKAQQAKEQEAASKELLKKAKATDGKKESTKPSGASTSKAAASTEKDEADGSTKKKKKNKKKKKKGKSNQEE